MTLPTVLRYILLVLLLPMASTQATAQTDDATAEMLMRRTGLWQNLGSIEPRILADVSQTFATLKPRPSPTETERVVQAATAAYAAPRMRATGLALIARGVEARHLPALKQWFDSAAGTNFSRLDEQAVQEQTDPTDVAVRGGALLRSMPASRLELLQQINSVAENAEMMARIMVNTAVAMHRGIGSVVPRSAMTMTEEQLRAALQQQRPAMIKGFNALTMASMALAYEAAPAADLQHYLDLLRSDAGRHLNSLVGQTIDAIMSEAALDLGRRLPGTTDKSNT